MARYVDGFVVPVPKKNIAAYQNIAKKAGKIWKEHGALDYIESIGDDLNTSLGVSFNKLAKIKPNEVVFFSYIVYKSRAHRDRVNKKVMKDPRLAKLMQEPSVFNYKRMAYGGFKSLVDM